MAQQSKDHKQGRYVEYGNNPGQVLYGTDGGGGGETLAQTLVLGNETGGTGIVVTDGDVITGSAGEVVIDDDLHVTGKLTVDGLIDPTGLVLDEAPAPSTVANKGALFVSDGSGGLSPNSLYYRPALDAVPLQVITSMSSLNYKGTWNADANVPVLGDGGAGGDQGDYYVVSVAGTTSLDGVDDWEIGDWVVNNGTIWQKIDNTDQVVSVAGKQGIVTLDSDDISNASTAPGVDITAALDALIAATVTFDNEFHVATNGTTAVGGADGSLSKPFDNFQDAFDAAQAAGGDRNRIVVHPGVYVESPTLTSDTVTFIEFGEALLQGDLTWVTAPATNFRAKLVLRGSGDGRPNYSGYISNGIDGNVFVQQTVTSSRYVGLHLFSTGISGNVSFTNAVSPGILTHFFMAAGAVLRGDVLTDALVTVVLYYYNALSSGSASWGGAQGRISLHTLVNGEFTRPVITAGNAGVASGDWINVTFEPLSDLSLTTGIPTFSADASSITSFLANVIPPAGGYNWSYRDKAVGVGNDSGVPGSSVKDALDNLLSSGGGIYLSPKVAWVAPGQAGAVDDLDVNTPFITIQAAVDALIAAGTGGQVLVAPGTYDETVIIDDSTALAPIALKGLSGGGGDVTIQPSVADMPALCVSNATRATLLPWLAVPANYELGYGSLVFNVNQVNYIQVEDIRLVSGSAAGYGVVMAGIPVNGKIDATFSRVQSNPDGPLGLYSHYARAIWSASSGSRLKTNIAIGRAELFSQSELELSHSNIASILSTQDSGFFASYCQVGEVDDVPLTTNLIDMDTGIVNLVESHVIGSVNLSGGAAAYKHDGGAIEGNIVCASNCYFELAGVHLGKAAALVTGDITIAAVGPQCVMGGGAYMGALIAGLRFTRNLGA